MYFKELAVKWRPLLAAMIGMSCGISGVSFTVNTMGPHLIEEFNWSRSQYALVGALGIFTIVAVLVAGRLVDMVGVRRTALIGFVAGPCSFLVLSQMSGDFYLYLVIHTAQTLFCMTTTSTVFTRLVVQHIAKARGLALAVAASGPALTIATAGPFFNNFVADHGWRTGYVVLAIFMAAGGAIAIALTPPSDAPKKTPPMRKAAKKDYGFIFLSRTFWILASGIALANTSQFIATSHLNVILIDNGMVHNEISGMIALFAIGILVGRLICGIALDYFSASYVSAITMALPAVGMFLIASAFDSYSVLASAILMLGLSYGAEGDVISYLVARTFGLNIYGTVLGLLVAALSLGSSAGALLLSLTLQFNDSYAFFLILAGILALIGSLLFLLLPDNRLPDTKTDV